MTNTVNSAVSKEQPQLVFGACAWDFRAAQYLLSINSYSNWEFEVKDNILISPCKTHTNTLQVHKVAWNICISFIIKERLSRVIRLDKYLKI